MIDSILQIPWQSYLVLGQMAPYLLFGFLVAGVLSVCVSPAWVERHLGRPGIGPVFLASLFGVPLPLCSCSVIPVSASMRRHGASRASTTAFLLSTPQTGVDSVAITYALLGPVFAVFRPIAALVTGILGGFLVQVFDRSEGADGDSPAPACTEPCCAEGPSSNVVMRILRYALLTLPRDVGMPLLIGVVIAGAIGTLVPADSLAPYIGGGIGSMLLMMMLGIPIYVCATASVPIAVGFMHMGASPGAALAFLIAGPATNAATIATVWKLLGRRTAVVYLLTVAFSAIAGGLILDWLIGALGAPVPELLDHAHGSGEPTGWTHAWAAALLAVLLFAMARRGRHAAHAAPGS